MPNGYHHLTHDQRCQIYTLKKSGKTQEEIAQELKVSQSAISRELARNRGKKGYRYKQAHKKAVQKRHKASSVKHKMTDILVALIEKLMCEEQLSPEQISGRLKLDRGISISYEAIYLHIWNNKRRGGTLYTHLRRIGKKYNKRRSKLAGRGLIPNRVGIENRPAEVDAKKRVGDFEADTIVGANHRGAIVSLVERKTKITILGLISGPKADETAEVMVKRLASIKKHLYSITSDNGKEFAKHELVAAALNLNFFFARPYHSWERGVNENTNGLVRQYFPKGCDFTKLTQEEVFTVERKLNNRPRKTLGYRTPNEEFLRLTGVDLRCKSL